MLVAQTLIERDPWLPGVTAAVGLFVIGTSITLFLRYRDKQTKTLDYRVTSDRPIRDGVGVSGKHCVVYSDMDADDLTLTEIRFMNTGSTVIASRDFLEPITVYRPRAKIIGHFLSARSAPSLGGKIIRPVNSLERINIEPFTMNAGEWFTVRLLYSGADGTRVEVFTRIEGQTRRLADYVARSRKLMWESIISVGAMLFAIIVLALAIRSAQNEAAADPSAAIHKTPSSLWDHILAVIIVSELAFLFAFLGIMIAIMTSTLFKAKVEQEGSHVPL